MTVSRETQTAAYMALLRQWGASLNLVSRLDLQNHRLEHHYSDSISVVPHLPPALDRLIDLGSGQGFPAIPVAIETGIHIDLVESDRRKAAFLTSVLAKLQLRGTVWPVRIEAATITRSVCVTARALAKLSTLLTLAKPLLEPDGCCLFLKGATAGLELAEAGHLHAFAAEVLPTANPPSCLVKVTNLR